MAGHFLAVGYAITVSKTGTNNLTWVLIILAAVAGARLGWLAPIGIFVLYLLLHASAGHAVGSVGAALPWVAVALIAGFIGWQVGGRSILRHLGEREYRNRLTGVKSVNSSWQRWFRDAD